MTTIRDVARLAGVGHTTVSHALSGKRPVAAATRERILAAVHELGYQPNATARSLVSRRTRTIGLIAPLALSGDAIYPHGDALYASNYGEFIIGIGDRLHTHDYRLLCLVARDPEAADIRDLVRSGQVDGMLLLQVQAIDTRVAAMKAEALPFVAIGRPRDGAGVVRADADFSKAGQLAVEYLLRLGHRRIGFLTTGHDQMPVLGLQWYGLAGFRRAHRTHGLRLERNQVFYLGNEDELSLRIALAPLLEGERGVTALITTRDIEAVLALRMLIAHGRRVPDDVSVICLNDSGLTMLAQPPITVVRFSPADLIRTAVDLLIDMLDGRQPSRQEHLVPVELVIRGSTGPAAVPVRPMAGLGADHRG